MAKKKTFQTTPPRERAYLVGVELQDQNNLLSLTDSLSELTMLSSTAGLDVVGQLTQKLDRPNPETFIGSGKVEELKILVEETRADLVIFDEELNPRHQRELERIIGKHVRVIDRTALILDIFAQHASTSEGMLQVELAQYEYYLPRLIGAGTHLARQAGGGAGRTGSTGGVGLRGPGETQLEVDRRNVRRRITQIKRELDKVRAHRLRYRAKRKRSRIPVVALVGYTNAGKSTLLNRLAGSDIYVADQLFATLDPTTRRVGLPGGEAVLFTDTVGFIQKLPTTLVAAFRATLEEITEADLLLHVVDISHTNAVNQAEAVHQTLEEIGANHIPMMTVLNKVDKLNNPQMTQKILKYYPQAMAISALKGVGIQEMLDTIRISLFDNYVSIAVRLPYQQGQLISLFHEAGEVERIEHGREDVLIHGRIPGRLAGRFRSWQTTSPNTPESTSQKQ